MKLSEFLELCFTQSFTHFSATNITDTHTHTHTHTYIYIYIYIYQER